MTEDEMKRLLAYLNAGNIDAIRNNAPMREALARVVWEWAKEDPELLSAIKAEFERRGTLMFRDATFARSIDAPPEATE